MNRTSDIARKWITFRVHGKLIDFLDVNTSPWEDQVPFSGRPSVKDIIESEGIPHPEVAFITVNGKIIDFSYNVAHCDVIEIYDHAEEQANSADYRVSKYPDAPYSFILDVHLGTLARRLRLAGIDSLYENYWSDEEIVKRSEEDGRIILTRDVELLKRSRVKYGYWIRNTDPESQFQEVYETFGLTNQSRPFTRCLNCNGMLEKVEKEEVYQQLPMKVRDNQKDMSRCTKCGQLYWKGSHYRKLLRKLENVENN